MKGDRGGSEAGRVLSGMRKRHGGGRPKVMTPCPWCSQPFSAAEFRVHVPGCRARPKDSKAVVGPRGRAREEWVDP